MPNRFSCVAGRQPHVDAKGQAARLVGARRGLQADRQIAESTGVAYGSERARVADLAVGLAEEMRQRVRRPKALDRRVRHHLQVVRHDRHRQRDVEPIGDAQRHERGEVAHGRLDGIDRGHDVLPAAEQLSIVVGEDGRHLVEVQALDRVERKSLRGEAERHTTRADRFGTLGENRPEALRRALEHTGARIETIREARGWRRQRHVHELTDERRAELAEVRLEVVVEVRVSAAARPGAWPRCRR